MSNQAAGDFSLASWSEDSYDEFAGGKLTKARVTQDFTGAIQGSGTWEALMCYREDGTASYLGYERIVGTVDGRSGSFVVEASGRYDGSVARSSWSVMPGSGTDDLKGLTGTGEAIAPGGPNGSYTLDYDLG